jgi:Pre-SET motif
VSSQKMDTTPSSTPIPAMDVDSSCKPLTPHSEARKAQSRSLGAIVGVDVSKLPPGHDAKLEEHLMLAAHAQRFLTYENRSWYELSSRLQRDPAMAEVYEAMIRRCTPKEPHAPRIGIVNLIDPEEQRCPPWEFLWTNEVIYGVGVPPTNKNDLHGCDCDGPCDPKSKTCSCIQRQRKMVPELVESGKAFCYNPDGTLKGYLEKTVIIECNSDCLCDDNCVNRVRVSLHSFPSFFVTYCLYSLDDSTRSEDQNQPREDGKEGLG